MGERGEGKEGKEYVEKPQIQKAVSSISDCCCLVAQSYPTLLWPHGLAHQAPVSMGFPRQEYWNGLPFPSPRDLPDSGIECGSPALAGRFLPLSHPPGKPTTSDTKGKRQR